MFHVADAVLGTFRLEITTSRIGMAMILWYDISERLRLQYACDRMRELMAGKEIPKPIGWVTALGRPHAVRPHTVHHTLTLLRCVLATQRPSWVQTTTAAVVARAAPHSHAPRAAMHSGYACQTWRTTQRHHSTWRRMCCPFWLTKLTSAWPPFA